MADGPTMGPDSKKRKVRKPAGNWICSSEVIRDCLRLNDWTVPQLAKQMHMSTAIIDDWLSYKKCPKYAWLACSHLLPDLKVPEKVILTKTLIITGDWQDIETVRTVSMRMKLKVQDVEY